MKCLDLSGEHAERAYPILAGLVVPRPIAWVTTLNDDGTTNLAPFSFFNVFGDSPPLVIFAPGDRDDGTPKDTALNCQRCGEFVVNLVSEELCAAMARSAAPLPYGQSELEREGLAWAASAVVAPPRLRDAPAALECKVHEIRRIGENRLVFGIVERVWVDESLWDEASQRVLGHLHHPVGRMAVPDLYCRTSGQFVLKAG
ncbi:MAG TPA: flavin reductase family protein [Luteolibacter sp.]|nr:flavin reductase family protein [Luteolibacter sp.]